MWGFEDIFNDVHKTSSPKQTKKSTGTFAETRGARKQKLISKSTVNKPGGKGLKLQEKKAEVHGYHNELLIEDQSKQEEIKKSATIRNLIISLIFIEFASEEETKGR